MLEIHLANTLTDWSPGDNPYRLSFFVYLFVIAMQSDLHKF